MTVVGQTCIGRSQFPQIKLSELSAGSNVACGRQQYVSDWKSPLLACGRASCSLCFARGVQHTQADTVECPHKRDYKASSAQADDRPQASRREFHAARLVRVHCGIYLLVFITPAPAATPLLKAAAQ